MSALQNVVGDAVARNNRWMAEHATDAHAANPRPVSDGLWRRNLAAAHARIRSEWDAFRAAGRQLPRIEQLIDEHQGNEGSWRAGLLVHAGRPADALAPWFPDTIAALAAVDGLRFALWSVLAAGAELPPHAGFNAGVLRLHLGVDCPEGCALEVNGTVVPYRDGETILFDDTATHAAWNRSDRDRVTLFCEVLRPASGTTALANRVVQSALSLDPRFRRAPERASEWDHALNG